MKFQRLPTAFYLFLHNKKILLYFITLGLFSILYGQDELRGDLLSKKVTYAATNKEIKLILEELGKVSKAKFTYSSADVPSLKKMSLNVSNESLSNVLDKMFDPIKFNYKVSGNNIIIYKEKIRVNVRTPTLENKIVSKDSGIIITGTVSDEKGAPLMGASIAEKFTKNGVLSDRKGNFKLKVSDINAILNISFTGYNKLETSVGNQSVMNISLSQNTKGLDEVVVIGYGTVKKKDVTGAVGKVNVTEMQSAPVRSFEEALGGRIAGVQVFSNDGQPGAASTIVIRGNNSVTQSNAPLYVIDGFAIEDADNNSINPSDIESMEVLKDASATAIYGARGANGVILITTKKGKVGNPVLAFDTYYGIQNVTKTMKLMNAYDYVSFQNSVNSISTAATYLTPYGLTLEDYKHQKTIDWQNLLFQQAAMQNNYFSLSGGNAKTKYSFSGSVVNQDGVIINTGFKRYQGRMVLDQQVNDKLKVGVNVNYSTAKTFGITPATINGSAIQSNLMYSVWTYRPLLLGNDNSLFNDLIDPTITNPQSDYRINPIISTKNQVNDKFDNNIFVNAYAEYSILPKLKLRVTGGLTKVFNRNEIFNNSKTRGGYSYTPGVNNVNGSINNLETDNYLNENTLTYTNTIDKNNSFNLLGGFTVQRSMSNLSGFTAYQIPDESLGVAGLDQGTTTASVSNSSGSALVSYLGRANYTFMSRYIFTASIRSDGSSKFSEQNRWSYFPSGAFAWRFSEENFMRHIKQISDAKLRISYGITGNNRVNDFAYLSSILYPKNSMYSFNNTVVNVSQPGTLGNPTLKWESTEQMNTGLDVSLLDNRISMTVDYYDKKTYNLLIYSNLSYVSGFSQAYKNIGKVRNQGVEFSIATTNIKKNGFLWTSSFNISFNKNTVLALNNGQESVLTNVSFQSGAYTDPLYIAKIGQPVAQFYGYVWQGNYQYNDFNKVANSYFLKDNVTNNGNNANIIQPGDIKYKDINGDGKVDANDLVQIGNPYPIHIGGLSNNFVYKGFDLNIFFQWSYGNQVFNANRLVMEGTNSSVLNQFATYNNRWTPQNQNNEYFRYGGQGPYVFSSRVVEDASFLRLKTVSLGYNFSNKLLSKIKITALRIYSSGQNLYTWTKYSGLDPEVSTMQSTLTPGFDYSAYARARTITFGLKVTF